MLLITLQASHVSKVIQKIILPICYGLYFYVCIPYSFTITFCMENKIYVHVYMDQHEHAKDNQIVHVFY
jgi:hypothetical protein